MGNQEFAIRLPRVCPEQGFKFILKKANTAVKYVTFWRLNMCSRGCKYLHIAVLMWLHWQLGGRMALKYSTISGFVLSGPLASTPH